MKIGFFLESIHIPSWAYKAIEYALKLEGLVPCVIFLNPTDSITKINTPSRFRKKLSDSNDFLHCSYIRWDEKRYKERYIKPKDDAYFIKNIRDLLPHIPLINITSKQQADSDWLKKNDNDTIKYSQPDIIFQVGVQRAIGKFIDFPEHGFWSYFHGNYEMLTNDQCGFWETYYDDGTVAATLEQRIPTKKINRVLARIVSPTSELKSPYLTRNIVAWDSIPLLYLCLKKLIETSNPSLNNFEEKNLKKLIDYKPTLLANLNMFAKFIYRKIKSPPRFFNDQYWTIHISKEAIKSKTKTLIKNNFTSLKQPKGVFWADPFLLFINNKNYLFFEEYSYQKQKGIIKIGEIKSDNSLFNPEIILQSKFHLSFPFVFIEKDIVYLLPEQAESGELILYKCLKFPDQWEVAAIFLKGRNCFDPVLFKKDATWWLFVTERFHENSSSCVYTYLYFSNSLFGKWKSHPKNPISTDCRFSRSGGSIIKENNQIIRTVQDCSRGYGFKINYLKINLLSKTDYNDELIGCINPEGFNVDGIHTVNFCQNLTVIDSRKRKVNRFI